MTAARRTLPAPLPAALVEYVERRTGLVFSEPRRDGPIAGWLAALADGDAASHRYLLLLRYAVLNLIALAHTRHPLAQRRH